MSFAKADFEELISIHPRGDDHGRQQIEADVDKTLISDAFSEQQTAVAH